MMTDGLAAIKSGKCSPRFTVKGVAAATPLTIPLLVLIGEELLGRQTGRCHVSPIGRSEGLAQVKDISEKILYWLSLGVQLRALAERLLDRFADRRPASQRRVLLLGVRWLHIFIPSKGRGHGWFSLMGIVNADSH